METFSDANQDIFVLSLIGQKGFYLDFGCSDGVSRSNTYLLEKQGWKGLLFDYNRNDLEKAATNRPLSKTFLADLSKDSILDILESENCPKIIDYISLDIDEHSYCCLERFPFSKYKFRFMTFEHDLYANRADTEIRKTQAPNLLRSLGYDILIENVKCNGKPYEDWFFNPLYLDKNRYGKFLGMNNIEYQQIPI